MQNAAHSGRHEGKWLAFLGKRSNIIMLVDAINPSDGGLSIKQFRLISHTTR